MNCRNATVSDIPFLVEAIIHADKGTGNRLSYASIFDLHEREFIEILPQVLEEDIEGQELCVSGFAIAEADGVSVAACCAWMEEEHQSSNALKMTILHHFFSLEKLHIKPGVAEILKQLYIKRSPGMLQLESVYTIEGYRGKGLIGELFDFQMEKYHTEHAEIMLAYENLAARRAYEKYGFTLKEEKNYLNSLLPFEGMLLMQK